MSHRKEPHTAGGIRLRALREAYGKTQLDVELDANLGLGYLQRLELGKVQQPERETLERIVSALGVRFSEGHALLALFGYASQANMPNATETRWAVDLFQAEVRQDIVPVYLLDCSHRLLAWNRPAHQLFGECISANDNLLMPKLIFDPIDGIAASVINGEAFFPAQIRILHYEQERYSTGEWYQDFIQDMRHYKIFDDYWRQQDRLGWAAVPMRPVTQLTLDTGRGLARFQPISEPFVGDQRFRAIRYIPADSPTMRQCLEWQT